MSDDDFERDYVPNGRPQSTMAKSFSLALDDLFKIDSSIADLDAKVLEKKKAVSTQTSELEALEARLKATEERLKLSGKDGSGKTTLPSASKSQQASTQSTSRKTAPASPRGGRFEPKSPTRSATGGAENRGQARPVSSRQRERSYQTPPMPGALPPTPGASEGEYVLVTHCTHNHNHTPNHNHNHTNTTTTTKERTSADYVIIDKDGDTPTNRTYG